MIWICVRTNVPIWLNGQDSSNNVTNSFGFFGVWWGATSQTNGFGVFCFTFCLWYEIALNNFSMGSWGAKQVHVCVVLTSYFLTR